MVIASLTSEGDKEVLGLWIEQTEGAKFWLKVMNELRTRGLQDILIAVVDGLTGFPDAIGTVFPRTTVQTCIVHLIRNSLAFVSWKDRKKVMPDLKAVYRAESAEATAVRLDEFEARWGRRYPGRGPCLARGSRNSARSPFNRDLMSPCRQRRASTSASLDTASRIVRTNSPSYKSSPRGAAGARNSCIRRPELPTQTMKVRKRSSVRQFHANSGRCPRGGRGRRFLLAPAQDRRWPPRPDTLAPDLLYRAGYSSATQTCDYLRQAFEDAVF